MRSAFSAAGARVLDVHADPDHDRAVFSLAGREGRLAAVLLAGARAALERIDLGAAEHDPDRPRVHPHVGAVDVVPVVYLDDGARGAACAEALVAGDLIGAELEVPVFLYGALAGGRPRAELRGEGRRGLGARLAAGEATPDFGPARLHPSAGATLVGARPPLVAFNLELAPPATLHTARAIAARVRESGAEGLPGLRALGVELASRAGAAQLTMNVEDPARLTLAEVVSAVRRHAEVTVAELVGLVPAVALEGFPKDVPWRGGDPSRQVLENALGL
ncbi:MAG: glutamate formiminotransferase [Actinobacteria bacterium]|nr:MAG: glutamate formiminotransferase [Actinomycetota bacterium]